MIRAEIVTVRGTQRIWIDAPASRKEDCQQIAGARWDKNSRHWTAPLSWGSCKALRGTFGAELEIGEKLSAWAKKELDERINPSLNIREALEAHCHGVFDERLYPFQIAGAQFLFTAKQALLSDPMGAGKTVQVIAAARARTQIPALVVCPASMRRTWGREVKKWWPGIPVYVVEGTATQRAKILAEAGDTPGFVIINWEAVRLHSRLAPYGSLALSEEERTPKILNQIPFKLVVADEAHRMKDPKSKQTRAVWACSQNPMTQYRWALTGTPLTNAPDTLYPVLHFMDPNEWPSKTAFIERYCTPPDAPVYMADGSFKQIGEIQIGDQVIGFSKKEGEGRCLEPATVLAVNKRIAPEILKVTLESGKIVYCTPDHKWLSGKATQTNRGDRVFIKPAVGKKLVKVIDVPADLPNELLQIAGWLGGIHDGEGTGYCIASQSIVHNPEVCQKIDEAITALSINVRKQFCGNGTEIKWHARTRNDFIRFLNLCKPVKRHEPSMRRAVLSCQWRDSDEIVSIESMGEGEVVSLTTSTQTYVVYGYASHNCLKAFNLWGGLDVFGIRPDREEEFFSIFTPRFRRMPKEIILPQLPPIQPATRTVILNPKQKKAYATMADKMWAETEDGDMVIAANPISQLTRLTQFASSFAEIQEDGSVLLSDPSSKLDAFMDDLDDLGKGIVVFAVSRQLLRMLAARFDKAKLSYSVIEGSQSADIRQNAIDNFQNGKVDYILVVVAAGGVGITLTRTDTMVFLQRPWSNVDYQQAIGRGHRIGSEIHEKINLINYVTEDTVEEYQLEVLSEKEELLQEIVRDKEAIKRMLEKKKKDEK